MTYRPELDGVRALAVLAVIAFHARVPGFGGGFLGVDVFFVLSGFLITSLLDQEHCESGTIRLSRFYIRRFLRLAPALLLMLAAYLATAPLLWPAMTMEEHMRDAVIAAAYLSDYARAFWGMPDVLRHTWSLAVEEHFYLLWPIAMLPLLRIADRRRLVALLLVFYILATGWRAWVLFAETNWIQTYYRFDTRLSGVLLGSLLAVAAGRDREWLPPAHPLQGPIALLLLVGAWLFCEWRDPAALVAGVTAAEIASALLIAAIVTGRKTSIHRVLGSRPLVVTGVLSYGLYLWHYSLALYLRDSVPWHVTFAIVLPFAFGCSAISYMTVERIGRRLRDRLEAPALVAPSEIGVCSPVVTTPRVPTSRFPMRFGEPEPR